MYPTMYDCLIHHSDRYTFTEYYRASLDAIAPDLQRAPNALVGITVDMDGIDYAIGTELVS